MIEEHHHSHDDEPSIEERVTALEDLLIEKGIITSDAVDSYLQWIEKDIGPILGKRIAARAWIDAAFKERLLQDAPSAIRELGIDPGGSRIIVVESTPTVHNLVCCTLCSCYPWRILGLPPSWYKSAAYRSRTVIDPRAVLREFGCQVGEAVEVRVWDSTSECRYMVLPERPEGTGNHNEGQLIDLITRDALIGVQRVPAPAGVS